MLSNAFCAEENSYVGGFFNSRADAMSRSFLKACSLYCRQGFIVYPKGTVKDGTRCQYGQVTNNDICIGGKCVVRWYNNSNAILSKASSSKYNSMKRLGVFLLPLDGVLVYRRSFPRNLLGFPHQFAGTHLSLTPMVERGTVRVKCLAQEHNTVSPARARTRTARSGDERTNHVATAPPTEVLFRKVCSNNSQDKRYVLIVVLENLQRFPYIKWVA